MYSASLASKLTALRTAVKTVLDANLTDATTFTIDTRVKTGLLDAKGRLERIAVMGNPIRYGRIAWLGNDAPDEHSVSAAGASLQTAHRFALYLWLGYADAALDANASETLWRTLLEAGDDVKPGLLRYLRETSSLTVDTVITYLGNPENVYVHPEPVHLGDGDYAHYCEFSLTLT